MLSNITDNLGKFYIENCVKRNLNFTPQFLKIRQNDSGFFFFLVDVNMTVGFKQKI